MQRSDTDDLARRYYAGESVKEIADSLGVKTMTLYGRMKRDGVVMRKAGGTKKPRIKIDASFIEDYVAGESELSISKRTGISRPTVRRRLIAAGVQVRNGTEANLIRMAKMTPEDRLALTEAAHAAVRGTRQSLEHRVKTALTTEANPPEPSEPESVFDDIMFFRHDVTMHRQKAVGPYNLDFALTEDRIAVEIFGGNWHASGKHAGRYRKRTDYLIDAGWSVVIVWTKADWPITVFAPDYVIALRERLRLGEPRGRQEHVIRGNGDVGPVGEFNPENGSIKLNFNPGNPTRCHDGSFGKKA